MEGYKLKQRAFAVSHCFLMRNFSFMPTVFPSSPDKHNKTGSLIQNQKVNASDFLGAKIFHKSEKNLELVCN